MEGHHRRPFLGAGRFPSSLARAAVVGGSTVTTALDSSVTVPSASDVPSTGPIASDASSDDTRGGASAAVGVTPGMTTLPCSPPWRALQSNAPPAVTTPAMGPMSHAAPIMVRPRGAKNHANAQIATA
jgi:hypothetical protein